MQARQRGRRESTRPMLPGNTSLIWQSAVGVLAFLIAIAGPAGKARAARTVIAGDPTRTIHFVLANALDRSMGRHDTPRPRGMERAGLRDAVKGNDPQRRGFYTTMVAGGWFAPAFALLIAMIVVGSLVDIADDRAGDYAIGLFFALCLFCCAGGANAVWRMYWYVPQARRRLAKYGPDSEAFATSMRRTLPRNSSLVFQAAVAVLVFVLTVS